MIVDSLELSSGPIEAVGPLIVSPGPVEFALAGLALSEPVRYRIGAARMEPL